MDTKKLNDWISLVANVGVVLGLVFLVIELRQNTTMMKATLRQEWANGSMSQLTQFAEQADVMAKVLSPEPDWASHEEAVAADMLMTSVFRGWENQAWMHKEGLMDSSEWVGLVEDMRHRGSFPYPVEQWHQTRLRFSVHLRATLDPMYGTGAP